MNDGRLAGKRALVTGSTRGMGEAIATRFAELGAHVMVSGRTEEDGLAVVERIRDAGGNADWVRLDLADEESVRACIEQSVEVMVGLDVLVNNAAPTEEITGMSAGGYAEKQDGQVTEVTTERWRSITVPAIDGLQWTLFYALPHLLKSEAASIVNISSLAGAMGVTSQAAYSASKGAMNALTRAVAAEFAPTVRCNCLVAGGFETPALATVLAASPELRRAFEEVTMLDRIGQPEEMAQVAAFFASDESSFITGQCLPVDGGQSTKYQIRLADHSGE
jgi:NAD(P)-dependent dehydrogenase (short-subunit alcohol dehydrogenase family)